MSKKIEDVSRQQIARFLPDAIAKALTSYHRFAERDVPQEPKDFSAHHIACKVAVAHIDLLLKLARWADLPDARAEDHNNQIVLGALLQEAENELRKYRTGENSDDNGDESDDE